MSETPPTYEVQQFALRLPDGLHGKLKEAAANHVPANSMNTEIIERLARSFEQASTIGDALAQLDFPAVLRLRGVTNTTRDVERLLPFIDAVGIDRWIFAARADELNHAVMVIYGETAGAGIRFISDHSYINMARPPRMSDVQTLFRGLDDRGVALEYCPAMIADTRELAPDLAAAAITQAKPRAMLERGDYLKLLAGHRHFELPKFSATLPRKTSKR